MAPLSSPIAIQIGSKILTVVLAFVMGCSLAFADSYPIKGAWVARNADFPIGTGEICTSLRMSGVEAVGKKLISELVLFNENKRYVVRQNAQTTSTLVSVKPTDRENFWVTEFLDARRRYWFRQKITYLLRIVDPATIEIQSGPRKTSFTRCGPKGRLLI